MLAANSFDYAVLRIVPLTEREEFFNAGVLVFCPQRKYLAARVYLDTAKLAALAPHVEISEVQRRLDAVRRICEGDSTSGPIAQLSQRARFHWLVAPRSTLLQVSPVHSGVCDDPEEVLERLFREQVRPV